MEKSDVRIFHVNIGYDWKKQKITKLPMFSGWQQRENTVSLDEMTTIEPYGVNCGESGLVVIDFDKGSTLKSVPGMDKDTMVVVTQSGGFHFYYSSPDAMKVKTGTALAPNVDVRARGGFVVGPGTDVKVEGKGRASYRIIQGGWDTIKPLPSELWDFLEHRDFIHKPPSFHRVVKSHLLAKPADPVEVAEALRFIKVNDYSAWRNIGFALKTQGMLHEFLQWSRDQPGFKSNEDCMKQWNKWGADGISNPVTIGTLFHLAKEAGWERKRAEQIDQLFSPKHNHSRKV